MKSFKKVGAYALAIALSASALVSNVAYATSETRKYIPKSEILVRSAKSSDSSTRLGTIKAGQVIEGVRDGAWIRFTFEGRTAYTAGAFYTEVDQDFRSDTNKFYVPSSSILVRSAKSSSSSTILGTVSAGQVIEGVEDGAWIRFIFNGRTAYTAKAFYRETASQPSSSDETARHYVSSSSILARSAKSSSRDTILGTVRAGQVIEGVEDGAWIRFTFNGRTAYTAKSFYTEASEKSSIDTALNYKASGYINVRAGKGTGYEILGTLPTGTVINAVREGDWLKLTYNGRTAYTAAAYYQVTNQSVTSGYDKPSIPSTSANSSAGKAAAIVRSKVGYPYYFGAAGPNSFDCSGLTMFAYSSVGVSIPRGAQAQSRIGTTVSYSNMKPGDLIFFGSYEDTYHVAMYVGNGQIVHASTPSTGVIMDSVDNVWIRNNYYTVKRIAN